MKKCLVLLSCLLFMGGSLFGQQVTVSGTVTDASDGSSLPGVTIQVEGTTTGTVTDIDGNYEISVASDAVLVFSFIGMVTQRVEVEGRQVIDVQLVPDMAALEEVIVVAYGTAERGTFTGSASTIGADRIEGRPVSNVGRAIEGTSPGVQVTSGSGQPGSGQSIRIRGFGSLNATNEPLYVVDGVPYDMDINNLNPNDIDNISVLKDAAATALYGNRAANGVVMITTKSGSRDRTQFRLSMSQGFSNRGIPEYDRVGPDQWMELAWETLRNELHYINGVPMEEAKQRASNELINNTHYNPYNVADDQVVGTDGKLNPNASLIYAPSDLDWEDAVTRLGNRSDISMNYSGGTPTSDYYVSLGYLNDEGYLINTNFDRLTGRININSDIREWFSSGINISANRVGGNNARDDSNTGFVNPFYFTRTIAPIFPIYQADPNTGEYILDDEGNKQYDIGDGRHAGVDRFRPQGANAGRHIVAETKWNVSEWTRSNIGSRAYGTVHFLDNFSFTANAGLDVNSYLFTGHDNHIVGDGAPDGRGRRTNTLTTTLNLNQLLEYSNSFGPHSIDLLFGHEFYSYNYEYTYGFRQGLITEGNLHLVNYTSTNSLTSYEHNERSEGYFTNFSYGYDDRMFFSASYRRDGSSRFYEESRWGDFFSLGASWRVDREDFMRDYPFVNMLLVRASYGQVGNNRGIGYYPWQALYSLNNNADEPGFRQSSLPAYDLVWESNNTANLAVEFGMFERLRGQVEFFHRVSSNLLFDVPLPVSTGVLSVDRNIGEMYNQGLEMRVAYDILADSEFQWTLDVNATTFKNEITSMPQDEIYSGSKKLMEGRGLYDFWIRQWYGVDPEDGRGLYYADTSIEGFNPEGDYVRVKEGDTLVTGTTYALWDYSGSAIPDVVGGINNTFRYRNFELSMLLTYQIGGWINESQYGGLMKFGNYGSAMHANLLDNRWQQPGDQAKYPRLSQTEVSDYPNFSTLWQRDASYLNIRSINLSYRFPSNIAQRLGTQNLMMYVSAENLHMFSDLKGMNVQQSFAGVTSNTYTAARTIVVGLNVSL